MVHVRSEQHEHPTWAGSLLTYAHVQGVYSICMPPEFNSCHIWFPSKPVVRAIEVSHAACKGELFLFCFVCLFICLFVCVFCNQLTDGWFCSSIPGIIFVSIFCSSIFILYIRMFIIIIMLAIRQCAAWASTLITQNIPERKNICRVLYLKQYWYTFYNRRKRWWCWPGRYK